MRNFFYECSLQLRKRKYDYEQFYKQVKWPVSAITLQGMCYSSVLKLRRVLTRVVVWGRFNYHIFLFLKKNIEYNYIEETKDINLTKYKFNQNRNSNCINICVFNLKINDFFEFVKIYPSYGYKS